MSGTPAPPALRGPLGPALFRVIGGSPTPEEVAVVAALVTALMTAAPDGAGPAPEPEPAPARWRRAGTPPPASWRARA
ncbi:acyl-CoA carboxylase epsilon subunit [Streptomyces sp. NPDC005526]|uniref:acyl-CoA carboxylase epsilon subunit n=1 Tax=Streptomyces sp. NPDC005526 TaxID=3156885 RepID=UPI0033BD46C4